MIVRPAVVLLAAILSLGLASLPARAQAPEGNAHPETQRVSEGGAGLPNPFGPANLDPGAPRATPNDKADFSRRLDLEPLRSLAVSHNGRVKILDTLARETVTAIAGRRSYIDYLRPEDLGSKDDPAKVRAHHYDPLFTTLDLIIDPGYYADKPLLAVGYLPLRRDLLRRSIDDEATRERWLRVGRVTPVMFVQHVDAVQAEHQSEPAYLNALFKVQDALMLWTQSHANLLMAAPDATDKPWVHLAMLASDHPARRAAEDLGRAWRAMDADAVNKAAVTLASILPTINAAQYPAARRSLEMAYNRANAFEYGALLYFLSLLSLILAFGTQRRWLAWIGVAALLGAMALHGFGFAARCIIAERFAIQNQFESMTGLSLFAALVGLVIMLARRQWLFGAASAGVGFLVLLTATQTAIPGQFIEREAAILNTSVLLKYHVTTVLVSYGLIALGFIISLFYLGTHYAARLRGADAPVAVAALGLNAAVAPVGRARTLADLDTAQMTVLQLAFWTLGVGILLGAWWADHSWGRWWAFDPKETWALITWIVYLIAIHLRFTTTGNRGLITAWLSVIGFIVMLWTYFGVNLILPGLHAYA